MRYFTFLEVDIDLGALLNISKFHFGNHICISIIILLRARYVLNVDLAKRNTIMTSV